MGAVFSGGAPHVPYRVVHADGAFEVRAYSARAVAETTVIGRADDWSVTSRGFNALAGYIFGGNGRSEKIAMTAPVETRRVELPCATGAPVTVTATPSRVATGEEAVQMRFYLPTQYTADSAPPPNNPYVTLEELPAQTFAVVKFSGSWTEAAFEERQRELKAKLGSVAFVAKPNADILSWRYDPPWTPSCFRTNEVAIEVVERRA